ncbi:MAG TPA: hypothetical protein VEF04_04040, partial [Blastocatellia bacterium]|nr:hypothetical protein [Blastocatellia bacterium]
VLLISAPTFGQENTTKSKQKTSSINIKQIEYHGWKDSILISNGQVEAVIVPAIGRVMQFRFVGEEDGPFWENRTLDGQSVDPESNTWMNFGGDKSWPAPQSEWPKIAKRGWPPPAGFDSSVTEPRIERDFVELTSPVDRSFGIRVVRRIELDPKAPVMRIKTTYEKATGEPNEISVWVITQLKDPLGIFVPLPKKSIFPEGYTKQSEQLPEGFKVEKELISLTRDTRKSTKFGTDSGTLLWIGEKHALRIDSERLSGAIYPDNGSSAEVYTNAVSAQPYIELEMLGPLKVMRASDSIESTSIYTLLRRTQSDVAAEAKKILKR